MNSTLIGVVAAILAQGQPQKQVVFVCEHGTVKSTMAMALFQQMAKERGLPYTAVSRGVAPDSSVPSFMREGLQGDGLSLGAFQPTKFSDRDVLSASLVVSF